MPKEVFVNQMNIVVTAIAQSMDAGAALIETFYKRGYGSGTSAITDDDLAASGITAAQFINGIVFLEQLVKLRGGQAVTSGDYGATLATLRRDI
jgi:hypothetical protein